MHVLLLLKLISFLSSSNIKQFLIFSRFQEACQCITELNSPDRLHLIVRLSIEHTLEMNAKSRLATGGLFHGLMKENILSVQQYLQG